jgi:hypothetical protein
VWCTCACAEHVFLRHPYIAVFVHYVAGATVNTPPLTGPAHGRHQHTQSTSTLHRSTSMQCITHSRQVAAGSSRGHCELTAGCLPSSMRRPCKLQQQMQVAAARMVTAAVKMRRAPSAAVQKSQQQSQQPGGGWVNRPPAQSGNPNRIQKQQRQQVGEAAEGRVQQRDCRVADRATQLTLLRWPLRP